MESPADRRIIDELLAANKELVTANRQIAETLARLERQYASQLEQNKIISAQSISRLAWLNFPGRSMQSDILMLIVIAMIIFSTFR